MKSPVHAPQFLDAGKAMERWETRAATMEYKIPGGNPGLPRLNSDRNLKQDGGPYDGAHSVCQITWLKVTQQQPGEPDIRRKGSKYPHQSWKTAFSVYGQTCRGCDMRNYFEIVYLKPRERAETRAEKENENWKLSDNEPSDKDE